MNISDYIRRHAEEKPDHPALLEGDSGFTYAELFREYQRWANILSDQGLRAGDRLGLGLRDNSDNVIAALAAAHLGVTIVPVDWRAPHAEKQHLAEYFDISLVLLDRPGKALGEIRTITVDDEWHKKVARSKTDCAVCDEKDPTLLLLLSSGTTGLPKGAVVSHRDFIDRMARNQVIYSSLEGMRYLSSLPLCFSASFVYCHVHLLVGNTVFLYPPLFSAGEIVDAIDRLRIDFVFLPPTVLRWLLALPEQPEFLLPGLKVLLTTSAPIPAAEKRAIVERINPNLYDNFAASQAGMISVLLPSECIDKPESVGRLNKLLEGEVVDENDQPVPAGVVGRFRCRGAGVSRSYYGEQSEPGKSETIKDGWCYTGDLAELDEGGFLYLRGRADDLIIRGGANIYPRIVEGGLLTHPSVLEAAVVGRDSATHGQEVVAFVRIKEEVGHNELIAYCLQKLPANAVPSEIRFVKDFPRTTSGKVRKPDLLMQLQ